MAIFLYYFILIVVNFLSLASNYFLNINYYRWMLTPLRRSCSSLPLSITTSKQFEIIPEILACCSISWSQIVNKTRLVCIASASSSSFFLQKSLICVNFEDILFIIFQNTILRAKASTWSLFSGSFDFFFKCSKISLCYVKFLFTIPLVTFYACSFRHLHSLNVLTK